MENNNKFSNKNNTQKLMLPTLGMELGQNIKLYCKISEDQTASTEILKMEGVITFSMNAMNILFHRTYYLPTHPIAEANALSDIAAVQSDPLNNKNVILVKDPSRVASFLEGLLNINIDKQSGQKGFSEKAIQNIKTSILANFDKVLYCEVIQTLAAEPTYQDAVVYADGPSSVGQLSSQIQNLPLFEGCTADELFDDLFSFIVQKNDLPSEMCINQDVRAIAEIKLLIKKHLGHKGVLCIHDHYEDTLILESGQLPITDDTKELPGQYFGDQFLSNLIVDKKYRFWLPGLGKEIKLGPLPKSLILLCLFNGKGIESRKMSLYIDDLFKIYNRLSKYDDKAYNRQLIRDFAHSEKIDYHLARIRNAFRKILDDAIYEYYIPKGKRGAAKKIDLPLDMVKIQCDKLQQILDRIRG